MWNVLDIQPTINDNTHLSVICYKKELCYHNLSGNNKIVVLITLLSSSFYINFGPKQISHKLDFLIEFLNNWAESTD